ncbi:uncharacterized protein LOC125489381 [Plutella xylostella]|uniref:uncharacterized protein LOC125489381 n=1 Tax=Plutella xylostella TaxID=51655 RepID=UPI002033118E|nr:uncharacterized protein LOC125489381 [Plutella xylostella]
MKCEYLSEDILQASFVKCISPVYYAQLFCGTNRIDIRDNFATPATKGQKLYSCLIILCTTLSYLYYGFSYYQQYSEISPYISYMAITCMVLHYTTYLIDQSLLRLNDQRDFINLVISLQKIDYLLDITHESNINDPQYRFSAVVVPVMAICLSLGFAVHMIYTVRHYPIFVFFIWVELFGQMIEIFCVCNYIYYITVRMRRLYILLQMRLSYFMAERKFENEALRNAYQVKLRNDIVCLRNIFDAFKAVAKIFRYQVSIYRLLSKKSS